MPPARELVWVVLALFSQKRRNAGNAGNTGNAGRIPGESFGIVIIMVWALLGRKMIADFHKILISRAEFT